MTGDPQINFPLDFPRPAIQSTRGRRYSFAISPELLAAAASFFRESETTVSPYGPQAHGGFDCSGFVWRVYKLQAYANEGGLADTLQGRTTYAMSGEVPKSKRIALAKLQPADVIFFGAAGPKSKPAQVDHMGIYLGNGWLIQSSRFGVAIAPLTGWYEQRFAWGRRPLAEAGLVSAS